MVIVPRVFPTENNQPTMSRGVALSVEEQAAILTLSHVIAKKVNRSVTSVLKVARRGRVC